jgi:hypothetical protein
MERHIDLHNYFKALVSPAIDVEFAGLPMVVTA